MPYYKGSQGNNQLMRLSEVTFTLSEPNVKLERELTWCNTVPKGKRNKPAKINGVQHHEISDCVEHQYYMPVQ